MVDLTETQKEVLRAVGHQLVTGGPGSGKTTVSILKGAKIARDALKPGQQILFLSFARATVSRVLEAIDEESAITPEERRRIEVDTYHSFFWRILKTHGYLVGFPRRMTILTPPNEAIALSAVRSGYKAASKLSEEEKADKRAREEAERIRLATEEGRVCFDLFADRVAILLHGSNKVRSLISTMYPYIILDEFQDNVQWFGSDAIELTYKDAAGKVGNELLYRDREADLEIVEEGRPWSFDGDGALFRLVSEAQRIHLAHLFDPVLAVHTSVVEPLPHQITAVYESMLPRQPLRFLLAEGRWLTRWSRAGTGTTIKRESSGRTPSTF